MKRAGVRPAQVGEFVSLLEQPRIPLQEEAGTEERNGLEIDRRVGERAAERASLMPAPSSSIFGQKDARVVREDHPILQDDLLHGLGDRWLVSDLGDATLRERVDEG